MPHDRRYATRMCIIGDAVHVEEAKKSKYDVDVVDLEKLKGFNKNKKAIKKWLEPYHILFASDIIIKTIPRLVGPILSKYGKFPRTINHIISLDEQLDIECRRITLAMKKYLSLCDIIGHVKLTESQIEANLKTFIEALISTVPKSWKNIDSIKMKTTMGTPVVVYPPPLKK